MIENILKKSTKFYQISLIVITFLTLGTVFYFWKQGFIDGSKGNDLHQASFILESYAKKNQFQEVKDLIYAENPKKAIAKIKQFESELEEVNSLVPSEEFTILKKDLQHLKASSAKLIAFSKTEKVVSVFTKKLNKFFEYVKRNNWRTLTRMSDRIYSKVSGHLNKEKLNQLSKKVLRDFSSMVKITENSILSRKDKSEIVSRISNLKTEMEMLGKYSQQRESFNKIYSKVNRSLNLWTNKVSPDVTLNKIQVEEVGRYYVLAMFGISGTSLLMFLLSFLFNKVSIKSAQREIEDQLEVYLNEGIVGGDKHQFDIFTDQFQLVSQNISSYIDKRMSYGSIFQNALPFSSILLDQNLKVIWANRQFCLDWQISEEEMNKDYMSWDFLNKLTNLGNNDPILEALKNNIAGIYQIQVKPNDQADVRAYEMFVSPLKEKGESRIMLFFYDLTNLQETIIDQSKSILNPVKQSVEKLRTGDFVASEQMEYEFKIAGIEDVYENFLGLNEEIIQKENKLYDEINLINSQIDQLLLTQNDLSTIAQNELSIGRENIQALKVFKENVIGLSQLSKSLDDITTKSQEVINTNIVALKNSTQKVEGLKNVTAELVESMPRLGNMKEEVKICKNLMTETKAKLAYELSQLSSLLKRAHEPSAIEKLSRTMGKVTSSYETLSTTTDTLDKKLSQLEVIMSKVQMIMNSGKEKIAQVNPEYENTQIQYSDNQLGLIKSLKSQSGQNINHYENEIVSSLHSIFNGNKELMNCSKRSLDNIETSRQNFVIPEVTEVSEADNTHH